MKKYKNILLKLIVSFSIPFLTLLMSAGHKEKYLFISCILSFIVGILIINKIKINKIDKRILLITTILSLFTIKKWMEIFLLCDYSIIHNRFLSIIGSTILIAILALPAMMFFIYLFIKKIEPIIYKFIKSLKIQEKRYLIIIFIIGTIITILTLRYTTAFSKPYINNDNAYYDVMYTTDTGCLVDTNVFYNVSMEENDIRQPLFGLLSLPFTIPLKFASSLLFFYNEVMAYCFLLTILQFVLLSIITILLGRMIKIKDNELKYFYIFTSLTSTFMIFSVILEQYVIALFYLIIAIYYNYKYPDRINYSYVGAVGTLITSGVIFPLITKFKNISQWIKDVFKVFLSFMALLIIGGQIPRVLSAYNELFKTVNRYTGKTDLINRLYQYTNFVKGIFISNSGRITEVLNHPSYQSISYQSVNIIGIVILFLCLIGYLLNKEKKIAKISGLWIIFSILLLFVAGYGTPENGLVLYSLYFGWAFIVLIYLLINKIVKNRKLFSVFIVIICIIMLYFNIGEIIKILDFALKYY